MNHYLPVWVACLALSVPTTAPGGSAECPGHQGSTCAHGDAPPDGLKKNAGWKGGVLFRGQKIAPGETVTVAEILEAPNDQAGKALIVEGTVRRACEHRGCWMELAETKTGPGIRVTFKDYGFFVPTDSAGARAKVAGTLKLVDKDLQLIATGVELRR